MIATLFRSAARERWTSLAIVLTIAIGIAALTTAFGIYDAAVWRLPPFHDAGRLVLVSSTHSTPRSPLRISRWSYSRIQQLRRNATSFESLANFSSTTVTLTGAGSAESVTGEVVSPEYFRVMAVTPIRGRTFGMQEDVAAGASAVVVLAYDFWQRNFSSDANVVGSTLGLSGSKLTIIGVMAPGFNGISNKAQFWIPTTMAPVLSYPEYLTTDQDFINVIARLKANVTLERARDELQTLGQAVYAAVPVTGGNAGLVSTGTVRALNDVRIDARSRRSLRILLSAVALLHLLACANVISLLLGRAASRKREVAIRTALGATRGKLLPVLAGDSALLVAAGGVIGAVLAYWATALMRMPADVLATGRQNSGISTFATPAFGIRAVLVAFVLTVASMVMVSWAPATSLLGMNASLNLRDGSRGFTSGGFRFSRPTARNIIVAIEAALAMLLLVAGSLMLDSFRRMQHTDLGIIAERVLTFDVRANEAVVSVAKAPAFVASVLGAIESVPGVVSATVDGGAPVSGSASSTLFIMGRLPATREAAPPVLRHYVGPDHFRTLSIPVIRGRTFNEHDVAGQPRVAIINELAAKRFWPNENPIGQRVFFGGGSNFNSPDSSAEIVGVVGDVAYQPLDQNPFQADFYTPYAQFTYSSRTVFVRTVGDPLQMVTAIRSAIARVQPDLPLRNVQTMQALIDNSWARQRFDAIMFGGFAALALLLSATGVYAVVSYAVNQRTREMGIRIALGATAGNVVRLVIREGSAYPLVGLVTGLVASLALGRVIAGSLYEASATDPAVMARTVVLLVVATVVACVVPALRATTADPLVAMRSE